MALINNLTHSVVVHWNPVVLLNCRREVVKRNLRLRLDIQSRHATFFVFFCNLAGFGT